MFSPRDVEGLLVSTRRDDAAPRLKSGLSQATGKARDQRGTGKTQVTGAAIPGLRSGSAARDPAARTAPRGAAGVRPGGGGGAPGSGERTLWGSRAPPDRPESGKGGSGRTSARPAGCGRGASPASWEAGAGEGWRPDPRPEARGPRPRPPRLLGPQLAARGDPPGRAPRGTLEGKGGGS